jgi:hypothetical protein
MSADNYIGVGKDNEGWFVSHGFMSPANDDCQYKGTILSRHSTEDEATIAAFQAAKEELILEYGVISLGWVSNALCGNCYVCKNPEIGNV